MFMGQSNFLYFCLWDESPNITNHLKNRHKILLLRFQPVFLTSKLKLCRSGMIFLWPGSFSVGKIVCGEPQGSTA